MEITLYEASFITGINPGTMRLHIGYGWLDALKKSGRWTVDYWELVDYASAKWDEGRILMTRPEFWQERTNEILFQRREKSSARTIKGYKRVGAANRKQK